MLFSLGQIEIVLVGQGGVLQPPLPPLATRLLKILEYTLWMYMLLLC